MRRNTFVLSVLAIVLILCAVVQPALAYFTANTEANGAIPLNFQYKTEIEEQVKDFLKTVTIRNTGGKTPEEQANAEPVWVRARAFAGVDYPLVITGGAGWSSAPDAEGWYNYATPVPVGEATTGLQVKVTGIPAKDAEGHEFDVINVAVVYETARVYYKEDGTYKDPNWTLKVDSGGSAPNPSGT